VIASDVLDRLFDARTALVVVDVQNDFADPNGSLFVHGADEIVDLINQAKQAARAKGSVVVLTQDWHPETTPHFQPEGPWPVHCVGGTWGAELVPTLDRHADAVVRKGTGGEDGYSAFTMRDPTTGEDAPTGLAGLLRERGVETAVIVGIAGDVCVAATAEDAARLGFDTVVLWEATRSVDPAPTAVATVIDRLRAQQVDVVGA
jgi:nicotinamidase/pyrazinamidase